MRLRTWTGWAGTEKKPVFSNRPWMFLYCLLSCMIKLYNLRGFLRVPCAFSIFTQYQNDLCPTQLSILLPISLCILSSEESVAGNLIMLSSAVDPLVESHVLNWFWSCSINLSKTPSAWFHLISDRVKTIDVSAWEMVVIVAQTSHCFYYGPGFSRVSLRWAGDGEIVKCLFFLAFTVHLFSFYLSLCLSLWSTLWPTCLLKALLKEFYTTRHDSDWWWQKVLILYRGVISGRLGGGGGGGSNDNCLPLSLPKHTS